jgi:large subunit ribosomal protein L10
MLKKSEKANIVSNLTVELKDTDGFVVADFKGLSVSAFEELRGRVREAGGKSYVVKNRLLKRTLDELKIDGLEPYLKKNTVLIYSKEDIIGSLKAVVLFVKEYKELALKGGLVSGMAYDQPNIIEISKLPGRTELIGMIAGGMNSVVAQFVGSLNAIITKFVGTVEALEKKKG